jgi:hypothetical protein
LKPTIIIGAANRKIFEKEKCSKRFAAPRLLGQTLPIQSAGYSKMAAKLK